MCVSAVVDTSEEGRLAECTLMKPYRESGQFSRFGELGKSMWISLVCDGQDLCCRSPQLFYQCV